MSTGSSIKRDKSSFLV
ncbi:MAG TPA: hypothetical protein LFV91_01405 [Rickettsia endosymbiont of Bembidion nr. Transversale]|nr:hypothetical protein [Rickettsia endosymbiont of Bembidion nr. Transversale]